MNTNDFDWNMVSALGGCASALATIIAVIFAKKALSTWVEQEKIKVKMEFKRSLLNLKTLLVLMPDNLDVKEITEQKEALSARWLFEDVPFIKQDIEDGQSNVMQFEKFILAVENCNACWVATEHLFDGSVISDKWSGVWNAYCDYLGGRVNKHHLFIALNDLYSIRFVFEYK
ncbi:hypothetical protein [Pantoea ananatis]|uniref:hypothetical protein n=1 Tax=Pantoea ananas TaxID=553 RepID=UPI000B228B83|nr:hypothetical protein [Pantoea ananatis]